MSILLFKLNLVLELVFMLGVYMFTSAFCGSVLWSKHTSSEDLKTLVCPIWLLLIDK